MLNFYIQTHKNVYASNLFFEMLSAIWKVLIGIELPFLTLKRLVFLQSPCCRRADGHSFRHADVRPDPVECHQACLHVDVVMHEIGGSICGGWERRRYGVGSGRGKKIDRVDPQDECR